MLETCRLRKKKRKGGGEDSKKAVSVALGASQKQLSIFYKRSNYPTKVIKIYYSVIKKVIYSKFLEGGGMYYRKNRQKIQADTINSTQAASQIKISKIIH